MQNKLSYIGFIFLIILGGVGIWFKSQLPLYHLDVTEKTFKKFPLNKVFVSLNGAQKSIESLHCPNGYLVNFWATWCPPCLEEMPSLEFLSRQLDSKREPCLVAISVDDKVPTVTTFIQRFSPRLSFPIFIDLQGQFASSLGITKFPETFLISPDGEVKNRWFGPQDWLSAEVLDKIYK